MKNFLQPGQVMTAALGVKTEAGKAYQIGTLWGMAANTAEAGEENEFALHGVYCVKNPDGVAIAIGALVGYVAGAEGVEPKIAAAGGGDVDMVAFQEILATDTGDVAVLMPGGGEGSAY